MFGYIRPVCGIIVIRIIINANYEYRFGVIILPTLIHSVLIRLSLKNQLNLFMQIMISVSNQQKNPTHDPK